MFEQEIIKIAEMIGLLDDRLRRVEEFQDKLITAVRQMEWTTTSNTRLGTKLEARMDQEVHALRNVIDHMHVMLDPVVDRVMPGNNTLKSELDALLAQRRPPPAKDA